MTRFTTKSLAGLAAGSVAIATLFTTSAQAAITPKVEKACKSDYKRLCPSYKVGSAQLRACMEAKQSEISSRCIDALIDSGEVDRHRARR